MTTLHLVDPDARDVVQVAAPFDPATQSVADFRALVESLYLAPEQPAGEAHRLASGARVLLYRPTSVGDLLPVLLYLHGGGMIAGTADMMDTSGQALADDAGALVVGVDYRLAPEAPFPAALDDAYAALEWLAGEAEALGVDPARIVVMGHSSGGGLAAALALLARDRGGPRLAGQVLVYPMLDPRTGAPDAPVDNPHAGEFMWTRAANRFGWTALRGEAPIPPERIGHYGPALATSLEGLPPAFVAVGALDLFLEEDAAYALRLTRAGVPVELHVYPGGVHGFDVFPGALATRFAADLRAGLRRFLGREV